MKTTFSAAFVGGTLLLSLLSFGTRPVFADPLRPVSGGLPTSFAARHVKILQMEQFVRFNYMDNGPGVVTARDLQYRLRLRAQVNLVGLDKTFLRLRAETGQGFSNSWNNTGAGLSNGQSTFLLKTLSIGQRLGPYLELHAGGLDFEAGAGTQCTYASGDGAFTGYRAIVKMTSNAANKVALTVGHIGGMDEANLFVSGTMTSLNYGQALLQRQIGDSVTASLEVDSISHVWFTREAVRVEKGLGGIVDNATVEAITRINDDPTVGWSASLSKRLDKGGRWMATGIYTDLPLHLFVKNNQVIFENQGEISSGRRISWGSTYEMSKNTSLEIFGGRRLDNTPALRWTAQAGISYQYGDLLNRLLGH